MKLSRILPGYPPNRTGRTSETTATVTIALVRQGLDDVRARIQRAGEHRIGIRAVDMQMRGNVAGYRRFAEHDDSVVDPVFGVLNGTVVPLDESQSLPAEHLIKKTQMRTRIRNDDIGRDAGVALGLEAHQILGKLDTTMSIYTKPAIRP